MIEEDIDKMKISNQNVNVILVGGSFIIISEVLEGSSRMIDPVYFGVGNVIASTLLS